MPPLSAKDVDSASVHALSSHAEDTCVGRHVHDEAQAEAVAFSLRCGHGSSVAAQHEITQLNARSDSMPDRGGADARKLNKMFV